MQGKSSSVSERLSEPREQAAHLDGTVEGAGDEPVCLLPGVVNAIDLLIVGTDNGHRDRALPVVPDVDVLSVRAGQLVGVLSVVLDLRAWQGRSARRR